MQAKDIMSRNPVCCTPNTALHEIAAKMIEQDCGGIPIIESEVHPKLVGIVTDRDIVCRAVAKGRNTEFLTAAECMTTHLITATPDMDLSTCCYLMETNQVRRLPVVDAAGLCRGIIAQADIAEACEPAKTAEVVRDISRHPDTARLAMH